eukprot:COSAG05_NODE_147_length_16383_cov_266.102555_6_plen_57_part_00
MTAQTYTWDANGKPIRGEGKGRISVAHRLVLPDGGEARIDFLVGELEGVLGPLHRR